MAPETNNGGKGIKLPFRMSELLSGASSIVSVVVVLIGLVVWSAKQEGRIGELEHRIQVDTERLADLDRRGTREMSERMGVLNEHVETVRATNDELRKRIDQINASGSQAGQVLIERLGNDERQAVLTREKVQTLDARAEELSKRISAAALDAQKVMGRLDLVDAEARRISEQQSRIGQALDSTYNLIQEHLRNGQTHTRSPP